MIPPARQLHSVLQCSVGRDDAKMPGPYLVFICYTSNWKLQIIFTGEENYSNFPVFSASKLGQIIEEHITFPLPAPAQPSHRHTNETQPILLPLPPARSIFNVTYIKFPGLPPTLSPSPLTAFVNPLRESRKHSSGSSSWGGCCLLLCRHAAGLLGATRSRDGKCTKCRF